MVLPLGSDILELRTTYASHNDHQDTSYATIPVMIYDEQLTPSVRPKHTKNHHREMHLHV